MLDTIYADITIYGLKLIIAMTILITALRHKER